MNRFYLNKEYTVNCNRSWAHGLANYKGNHRNECHVQIILFVDVCQDEPVSIDASEFPANDIVQVEIV